MNRPTNGNFPVISRPQKLEILEENFFRNKYVRNPFGTYSCSTVGNTGEALKAFAVVCKADIVIFNRKHNITIGTKSGAGAKFNVAFF